MTLILVSIPNFSALAISASAAFMSLHFSRNLRIFLSFFDRSIASG